MDESELYSMATWSAVTGIAMLVVGFSYRMYLVRNNNKVDNDDDICTDLIMMITTIMAIIIITTTITATLSLKTLPLLTATTLMTP